MTVGRWMIWTPGLAVAIGSAVATAHGLYEVAAAAAVPAAIAWLYPLITDGLALVAYAATARLHAGAARYAWSVVVLAAGLSGLAQAAYLAAGPMIEGAPGVAAPAVLRFGIGAWPAIAAAIVAHLLYLLATDEPQPPVKVPSLDDAPRAAMSGDVQPRAVTVQPFNTPSDTRSPVRPVPAPTERSDRQPGASPAGERARSAAARHAARHGHLPTVTELQAAAEVSRGTAAAALKHLRDHPAPLHLITSTSDADEPTIEERTQQ